MTDGVPRDELRRMLASLDSDERPILEFRFGLCGGRMHTLNETADHFAITREDVRRFEGAATTKLYRPPPS